MLLRSFHQAALLFIALFLLNGCSLFTPHRMDINQGQKIEQSALDKLKLGMSKEQVLFLLGSPSTEDLYTVGRWDYVEYLKSNTKQDINKLLVLWFKDDALARVAAKGYNVGHVQGEQAVRVSPLKRTIPTPQALTPLDGSFNQN